MSGHTLAEKSGLGRVVMCVGCTDVHLAIDSVSVRLSVEAFVALGEMIQNAIRHPEISAAQSNPKMFMAQQLFSQA
jgi:hypothetical protein